MNPAPALAAAVERLYRAFENEPAPAELIASPLRDPEGILDELTSAPLRQLEAEALTRYGFWAMTTVGDARDYRYFLPRILELTLSEQGYPGLDPWTVAGKLIMADWTSWPAGQVSAVRQFLDAAFTASLAGKSSERSPIAHDFLGAHALLGLEIDPLLTRWRSASDPNAIAALADFVSLQAEDWRANGILGGPYWEQVSEPDRRQIGCWLFDDATRRQLLAGWDDRLGNLDRSYLDVALAALET